ncbi:MAG: HAMP domain-containing sensor histidine kinase [Lachnospiraceae bacterium]|nr:HAMP domain-containing sensor histidine kinase [Lachnospiraceae bacterium]
MKPKAREILKAVTLCVLGVLVCCGIFYFVDNVWNGFFIDWFMRNYMLEYDCVYMGQDMLVREPLWYKIKPLLLIVLCVNAVFWTLVVFAVSRVYARRKMKETVTSVSREIQNYMQQDGERLELFPKEHAEISAQMASLKSTMQRHEQLLKEEAARKNDLITYLAHDLKTPLTSVIGYLSLLDEAPDMPAAQKAKYVNIALDKAQRLEKLINEFFDITRYNLQQIELEEENIDLSYMLVQMTDEFYPLLSAHGNTAQLRVEEGLTVYGDSVRLARVFNNILKNAIAYSYRDTVIEIWAERREQEVLICFRNKGKTIPPQKLEAVFEKFFRLDEARTTNTGGAGLGLAIAKEIVALHGGTITAKSEKELTTFCVSLPMED